ncbi:MAG: AbrB family transcriptional regulator [Magnetospirillum sp.]|nr:AbrB family transcriptional regulator [Magnetospirillum sp.]
MRTPRWTFQAAQAVIGCLVARAFTPSILASIIEDWALLLTVVATTVAAGAVVGWVLVKLKVLPGTTAAWGSSPGGASAMVALAAEFGADVRLVAFMQYLRVVIVVVSASLVTRLLAGPGSAAPAPHPADLLTLPPLVPFAATMAVAAIGAWLGTRAKVPAGAMMVPLVAGTVLHGGGWLDITLPSWLLGLAYVGLGWYVGLGFNRAIFLYALRALPALMLATLLLIGLCAGSAWVLTLQLHIDPLSAYLATSPGGLDSVAIIVVSSHADIPLVMAAQTLRLFLVLLTGPALAKLIARYA